MTKHDAKTNPLWTEEASDITDAHPASDRTIEGNDSINGIEQRQRLDRTVFTGRNPSKPQRLRPVTHGKTLSYLIRSVQAQVALLKQDLQYHQDRAIALAAEVNAQENELKGLEQALADWEGRVAHLKVASEELEGEVFDPTEELTA